MTTRNDIERVLWSACDSFRGKIDSSRYKDYILSMLFVKFLSDVSKEKRAHYLEQYDGDERRVERAMSRERFTMDADSTFDYLYEHRTDNEIGQKINVALSHIEERNSAKLRNVFRAIDFNSQVDFGDVKAKNATLRNLLEDFHGLDLRPSQLGSADIMALHKLNVFHWHLTDDQGWRIEIRKYPKLTEIGSVRSRTLIGRDPGGTYDENCKFDETPYGGYYTQDEIRDVVNYAAERFITVIPEIEFPGHAVGALASYPWLGCTGEQYEVRQTWDIDDRVFCIGKETTFEFIEGVLEEVLELFPSEYIHIGGDECPTVMWKKCPHCKARMKAERLKRPRRLQNYATARVEKFLNAHGRRLIGWDEILEGDVTPTATIMSWRGAEGGIKAAKMGNHAIMAPTTHCYLDYYQTRDTAGEPLAIGGYLPVEKVYSLDPYEMLTADEQRCILGVQANLWTEYIATWPHAEYMLLPRLSALAEVGWSLDRKDYGDYLRRVRRLAKIYDACGYNYAKHIFGK